MEDPFEELPENLRGKIKILSHAPVFTGTYSRVYRGKIRESGELVCLLVHGALYRLNTLQVAVKVLNAIHDTAIHTMRRVSLIH